MVYEQLISLPFFSLEYILFSHIQYNTFVLQME